MEFMSRLTHVLFVLEGPPSGAKGLVNGLLFCLYTAGILLLLL